MAKLEAIWKSELLKRERHEESCKRCDRNWPIHKAIGLEQFSQFSELSNRDGFRFQIVDYIEAQHKTKTGPWTVGQDSIVLAAPFRFIGQETYFKDSSEGEDTLVMEYGGNLIVHYTEKQGLVQVFLEPPRLSGSENKGQGILLWWGRNTDDLTAKFYKSLIRKLLMFCRVESVMESSSSFERLTVRFWRYMDIRNRKNLLDSTHRFLSLWEISLATAGLAIAGLVISLI